MGVASGHGPELSSIPFGTSDGKLVISISNSPYPGIACSGDLRLIGKLPMVLSRSGWIGFMRDASSEAGGL